jgi:hypothetical protein
VTSSNSRRSSNDTPLAQAIKSASVEAWQRLTKLGVTFGSDAHAEYARSVLTQGVVASATAGQRDEKRLREDALKHWFGRHARGRRSTETG